MPHQHDRLPGGSGASEGDKKPVLLRLLDLEVREDQREGPLEVGVKVGELVEPGVGVRRAVVVKGLGTLGRAELSVGTQTLASPGRTHRLDGPDEPLHSKSLVRRLLQRIPVQANVPRFRLGRAGRYGRAEGSQVERVGRNPHERLRAPGQESQAALAGFESGIEKRGSESDQQQPTRERGGGRGVVISPRGTFRRCSHAQQ